MDHVVPACLFPAARPQVMVTVPACFVCNQEKKIDDEYLRDWMVLDFENAGHSVAEGALKEKMLRAARRGQSRLAKDVRQNMRLVSVHTPEGLYLGHSPAMPLDYERANRIFSRIACGLYYQLYHRRLPDETKFEVRRIQPHAKQQWVQTMCQMGLKETRCIGQFFECMHTIAAEDATVTCWLMRFFHIFISVSTNLHRIPEPGPKPLTSWLG